MGICNMSVIQHLKKNVEYIRMCLLNLVKQEHTVWIPPNLFRKLSTLFISYISWRGADQFRYAVLLHIFRHIYPDHGLLTAKYSLCQRFGQFCLTNPGRPKEQKRTNGAIRIFQSYTASFYCLGYCRHSFLLADHPLMEFLFQACKTFAFSFCQLLHRYLRPLGYNIRHRLFINQQLFSSGCLLCFFLSFFKRSFQLLLLLLDLSCFPKITSLYCIFLLLDQFLYLPLQFFQLRNSLKTLQLNL